MGMPNYITYTTTGAQTPISLDWMLAPFNVSIAIWLTGTATYALQYTLDDVNDPTITPRWFDSTDMPTGTTASGVTNFAFPVRFIRVNIAALTGTLELKVIQGMSIN